jgi:DNA-3-methyladenine glycosylase
VTRESADPSPDDASPTPTGTRPGPRLGETVTSPDDARNTFPRSALAAPTLEAARSLLGARLIREPDRVGRIVEVEAYIGTEDRASHARMGPTRRNRVMFGPPGIAYVYLVYGMHHCLNVVTEPASHPAALLVRALEPMHGIDTMRAARARARRPRRAPTSGEMSRSGPRAIPDGRLAAGPAMLCAALEIDRSFDGMDLCDPRSPLHLEPRPTSEPMPEILATPRIGVDYAPEPWTSVPWRLLIAGSPSVSGRPPRGA